MLYGMFTCYTCIEKLQTLRDLLYNLPLVLNSFGKTKHSKRGWYDS